MALCCDVQYGSHKPHELSFSVTLAMFQVPKLHFIEHFHLPIEFYSVALILEVRVGGGNSHLGLIISFNFQTVLGDK